MFIFDQLNGIDFSGQFIGAMDNVYFSSFPSSYNSDALLTYFYFM